MRRASHKVSILLGEFISSRRPMCTYVCALLPQPLHRELGIGASARASLHFYNTVEEIDGTTIRAPREPERCCLRALRRCLGLIAKSDITSNVFYNALTSSQLSRSRSHRRFSFLRKGQLQLERSLYNFHFYSLTTQYFKVTQRPQRRCAAVARTWSIAACVVT